MIRKTVIVSLILGMTAWAAQDSVETIEQSRLTKIEQTVSKILSKSGINFSGEFRSQFLLSRVVGDAVEKAFRKDEGVEYTSVDFDISARPHSALQGHLIFRLHQDWRNLWSSYKNPISSRWISLDGLVKNVFGYNIGDFRQKYSPLTLYSPDIEIEYEPEIFARRRRVAMNEMFLGNNDRIVQGVNMNFDAEIVPLFKEFHLNVLGSRLRYVGDGEQGQLASMVDSADMDKYLIGSNLDLTVIPDLSFGGSFLYLFDGRYTYGGTIEAADTLRQSTRIGAGRLGVGTEPFVDPKVFNMALQAEVAVSSDDSSWHKIDTISSTSYKTTLMTEKIRGLAIAADLNTFIALGSASNLHIDLGFLRNAVDFRNELAQSPTFFPLRIMNSENDPLSGALYSTFDALYRHVFKFCPSENAQNVGEPAGWLKGPMEKIAYSKAILSQDDMRNIQLDNSLFLVMPYGPATPNRIGLRSKVAASFIDNAIHTSALFKYLNEVEGLSAQLDMTSSAVSAMPKSAFIEAGGGLSVNFASFGEWWPYPLILSGGYKFSNASNDGVASYTGSPWETTAHFINTGLYWTFWKRASLLGGLQYLKTTYDGLYDNYKYDIAELHWAAGLEYKVSDGGTLTGSFGFNDVTHSDEADANASIMDFRQWQTDLYLTVNF